MRFSLCPIDSIINQESGKLGENNNNVLDVDLGRIDKTNSNADSNANENTKYHVDRSLYISNNDKSD